MLFNCLLQDKVVTQALKGGNTAEFYSGEGTYNKSLMLQAVHPDIAEVKWKFGRWHHEVNYKPFKDNKLIFVDGYSSKHNRTETDKFQFERVRVR